MQCLFVTTEGASLPYTILVTLKENKMQLTGRIKEVKSKRAITMGNHGAICEPCNPDSSNGKYYTGILKITSIFLITTITLLK